MTVKRLKPAAVATEIRSPDEGRLLIVPWEKLSPEALTSIIEEYVTRDGTDYGEVEMPFERRASELHRNITAGNALIVFDTLDETCNIVAKDDFMHGGKSGKPA